MGSDVASKQCKSKSICYYSIIIIKYLKRKIHNKHGNHLKTIYCVLDFCELSMVDQQHRLV